MRLLRTRNMSKIMLSKGVSYTNFQKQFSSNSKVKIFSEVPSALSLPLIGTLHQYFPVIGKYTGTKLHHENLDKYRNFGPIIRENLTSSDPPLVNLFYPEDFETVFRCETQNPSRLSHLALEEYRLRKKNQYSSGGLLPTNGKEWWRLRRSFQKGLSSPKSVLAFLPASDGITMEWIETLHDTDKPIREDFLHELWKVFLELAGFVVLNHRFNSFKNPESDSNPLKLVEAALNTNHHVVHTDIGFKLWKIMETASFKHLREAQDYMEKVAYGILKQHYTDCKNSTEGSLVSNWSKLEEVDRKDILAMVIDFLLAGIDTSANTSSFLLYYVSKHPSIQDILYEECSKLLARNTSEVTEEVLHEAKFAKAVLKETLRLRPISIGIGRLLTEDRIIRGFHVPKGVNVLTNNQVACRMERHFHHPFDFIPERWLRHDPLFKQPHPFLLLPFGFGARACIARRLAEQNMLLMLMKVIRNFHLKWVGEELDSESHLIQKPDKPIRIKFIKRKDNATTK